MSRLETLGWTPEREQSFLEHHAAGRIPARVASVHGKYYRLWHSAEHEVLAEVPKKFKHHADNAAALPAIGDWVAVEMNSTEHGVITEILPRTSRFSRKVAGEEFEEQVIAANVDTLFVMQSLDQDFNLRRAERYLLTAWESGATPVILLNKADLCKEASVRAEEMQSVAIGVPVHVLSTREEHGLEQLAPYLLSGKTVAFVGSSGVGKSTLLNKLMGSEKQKVGDVREKDSKGKHTTTLRALFLLPSGCCVIDTPGMRELQLWTDLSGFASAFPEILQLAENCRFTDCRHESEPGCAVRGAVEGGELQQDRMDSYLKLQRESEHNQARSDEKLRRDRKQKERAAHRVYRKIPNRRT